MPLKTGNSRRVAESRPVCMGLKSERFFLNAPFLILLYTEDKICSMSSIVASSESQIEL